MLSCNALVENRGFVTAEMVKNALNGIGHRLETLLKLFEEHNTEFAKRVGVNRVKETLWHYNRSYELLKMFIDEKLKAEDVTLRSLTLTFIDTFDLYLRVDRLLAQATIAEHLINLKMGGRFNSYLTFNGKRLAGWIFSKSQEQQLAVYFGLN